MVLKGGTDIEDQCMGNYTTKMKSKRWPMTAFCFMLDTARVNSQSIWVLANDENGDVRKSNSYKFGMDLVKALIIPHIERRERREQDHQRLQKSTLYKMSLILGRDVKIRKKREAPVQIENFESFVDKQDAKRCYMCRNALPTVGYTKAFNSLSKLQTQCTTCGKAVCRKHLMNVCQPCARSFAVENQVNYEEPETLPETTESGPLCITDLFQNKLVSYF